REIGGIAFAFLQQPSGKEPCAQPLHRTAGWQVIECLVGKWPIGSAERLQQLAVTRDPREERARTTGGNQDRPQWRSGEKLIYTCREGAGRTATAHSPTDYSTVAAPERPRPVGSARCARQPPSPRRLPATFTKVGFTAKATDLYAA